MSRETFVTVIANLVDVYEREHRLMAPFELIPVAPLQRGPLGNGRADEQPSVAGADDAEAIRRGPTVGYQPLRRCVEVLERTVLVLTHAREVYLSS